MNELQLAFISNKSTARLLIILQFIERERKFTLRGLAEAIDFSERTTASDLKYLKEHFIDSVVFESGSKGYSFKEICPIKYKEQKKNLFENECLFEIIKNVFYGHFETIAELAHKYNYSETAFRRLLAKTNTVLQKYGLSWNSNPVKLNGNEASIRKFFKDFFYEGFDTPYAVIPDSRIHQIFLNKGANYLGNYEVGTGTTPQAFYYTLYIAMIRFSSNHKISMDKKMLDCVYKEKDFLFLYSVGEEINKVFQINLSKEEVAWVYLVTICKRTINRVDQEKIFYERFDLWPEISLVTKKYLMERSIPVKDQQKVFPFLASFFLSRKINDTIDPVLNKENFICLGIKQSGDKENFRKNSEFLKREQINLRLHSKYFEEICLSFTLYSSLILEANSSAKTVFFLLEGNHFICQTIRLNAQKRLGRNHHLKFIPIQMLTKQDLRTGNSDLIVTNYERYIYEYLEDENYVLIKTFPDEQDWLHIENILLSIN